MQCACDVLYCHPWSDSARFFHIISQNARFSTKRSEYKMCGFICSTTFIWNISHSNTNEARYYHKCTCVFMYSTCYFCQTLMKFSFFSTDFRKTAPISDFMKIRPVGAELFHADGQTDMTRLIISSHNFANAPKNEEFEYNLQYGNCPTYVRVAFRGPSSKSKFASRNFLRFS